MSSVKKRVRGNSATWEARWRDPNGTQRKRTFPKKSAAERYLTGIESRLLDGLMSTHHGAGLR